MKQALFTIDDKDGIHARPAGILVQRMQGYSSEITFEKGEKKADGKRLFAVMKMAVRQGDKLIVTADGTDEDDAIAAVLQTMKETKLIK
jgi:phosphocarrier protein